LTSDICGDVELRAREYGGGWRWRTKNGAWKINDPKNEGDGDG